ncbi:MAG: glycosyltransferase family 4 protein [Chloroflexi bacterium]|nr:MAG: glycosyltransferase family 4 protein [Chloroflexota bacterium]
MLIVDLRQVDPERPDAAGEYALQLTSALVRLAVHADVTVLEPGFEGALPSGELLLLPAGGRPQPGRRCFTAIHDSERVLAPSEAVGEALTRYLRVTADRVAIVRPGLEPGYSRTTREAAEAARTVFGLPQRYLLSFGDAGPAERAWAGATTPSEGAGLVMVERLRPDREQLRALLSGAVGALFTERLNGNPIRALQAMACGTPPIVADDGAFPELVRDGGLTVAPESTADWSEAISALYRGTALRRQLSARARELATAQTAEWAAREVLALI